jgi:hypothetical protein
MSGFCCLFKFCCKERKEREKEKTEVKEEVKEAVKQKEELNKSKTEKHDNLTEIITSDEKDLIVNKQLLSLASEKDN